MLRTDQYVLGPALSAKAPYLMRAVAEAAGIYDAWCKISADDARGGRWTFSGG
jgi:hypothetical protein